MAKRMIATTWIVGSVIMCAGGCAAWLVSIATDPGHFLTGNLAVSVPLLILCLSVAAVGVIVQLVAWIGAVANVNHLADKTWFNRLLWIGIAGILTSPIVIGGIVWWGLMLAYVVAGPDGMAYLPQRQPEMTAPAASPTTLIPTS